MSTIINTVETAKIARKILKEAFPSHQFSVKSDKSTHSTCLYIHWEDGPTEHCVTHYLQRLCGTYYDTSGVNHTRKRRDALRGGERVSFDPEFIFYKRQYSDQSLQRTIQAYRRYYPELNDSVCADNFKKGRLITFRSGSNWSIQQEIHFMLSGRSKIGGQHSHTASQIIPSVEDNLDPEEPFAKLTRSVA